MEVVRMESEKMDLYVAVAEALSYDGSLVSGETKHYLITTDSEPIFFMSYRENKEHGYVKEFKGEVEMHSILIEKRERPYYRKVKRIYIAKEPFKVWVRHRGYTGDRCDDYDKIITARKIEANQLHGFLKQFNL